MELDGRTTVVGVIGWPVEHSLSPPMHNAAFAALGMNWVYVPYPVRPEALDEAIAGVRALGIRGINVTIPHKTGVTAHLDELSAQAAALGAVNTIDNSNGLLTGHNTDGAGFVRSLREHGIALAGRRVAMIGAGGSARSVALACAAEGISSLVVANRTPGRAADIVALIRLHGSVRNVRSLQLDDEARGAIRAADVVIDATPVGMHPHENQPPVIPPQWLRPEQAVCDLVYTPRDTTILRAAREIGCTTVDGTGMLVHQGAIAFETWTGREAPVEAMRQALLAALDRRARA